MTLYIDLTGNTAPFNTVTLVARVQGYLESIDYVDGASVTKGTQLFGIEQDQYKAQLDQAKATLASDKATEVYDRWQYDQQAKLFKQDSTAQATLEQWKSSADKASAAILNAQAAVDLANINLGYTRVLAPFDGTVTNHQVDLGALVGVSGPTTLATIIQSDPLYVYFTVSEPQVLAIQKGSAAAGRPISSTDLSRLATVPVEIGLQNEEGYPHKGHLDYASPQLDSATGTLMARAIFDNKDHLLLAGLFVRVRHPDRASGQGTADPRRCDRDEPGRQLCSGGRPGQCRPPQNREDRRSGRPASDHRIRARPRRLGGDRGDSAGLSRRQGRSAAGRLDAGRGGPGGEMNLRGKRP